MRAPNARRHEAQNVEKPEVFARRRGFSAGNSLAEPENRPPVDMNALPDPKFDEDLAL